MEGKIIIDSSPRRPRSRFQPRSQEPEHKINEAIRSREVRIVGDNVGEARVVSFDTALSIARQQELDLVMIVENAEPPVCRVVDYKKFLYQQKKRQREQKAKSQSVSVKEIRFGPNTDEHDYQFKLRHAEKFLKEGSKVKAFVHFRGRAIVFKEQGEILLLRFAKDLDEFSRVEQLPQLEGKRMYMFLAPLKGKKK